MELNYYKDITHSQGYNYFLTQIKNKFPETDISRKHFIIYVWDSTMYDVMSREQMKVLDSMAANFSKLKLECVFVTEMEETASNSFF